MKGAIGHSFLSILWCYTWTRTVLPYILFLVHLDLQWKEIPVLKISAPHFSKNCFLSLFSFSLRIHWTWRARFKSRKSLKKNWQLMRSGSIMYRKLARRWLRAIIMPPKVWLLVWVKLPASGLNCWGLQSRKVRSRVCKKWIPKFWIPPSSLPPWIYLAASVRREGCYSFASLWLPLLMKKLKKSNLNSSHYILTQFFSSDM